MVDPRRHHPRSLSQARNRIHDVDETTPLVHAGSIVTTDYQTNITGPKDPERGTDGEEEVLIGATKTKSVTATISILLIGVFISQADTSLVLATYGKISSEFNDLERGSWLLSSYMLAMCVSQPLFGKLSDIYGRKMCLLAAYLFFVVGTAGSGLGRSMNQIIAARAVQGAGGAGMVCMVSILLTDLLQFHEVALYRSYVNVVQTVGRSCGGVIGGFLASTIGWRWAFLAQVPAVLLSIGLVFWRLEEPKRARPENPNVTRNKLCRIDFIGAACMSLTILTALFVLDTGGQKYEWRHPVIIASTCIAVISGLIFYFYERDYASEPIFPVKLLTSYVVVTSYALLLLQNLSQTALMFIIPIYFQTTRNATTEQAGAYLIPAVIGNAVGGLLTGSWIKRTGSYKIPTILASTSAAFSFTLLILFWHGHTSIAGSFLITPAGFATGVAHSAVFIGLTSGVSENNVAIAGSGLYLSGNIGGVTGVSAAAAAFQITLRSGLKEALAGREDSESIIRKAISDIGFVQRTEGTLHDLMIPVYIHATQRVLSLGLFISVIAFAVACISREKNLLHKPKEQDTEERPYA
ncbi:MFS general substrate transporter [Pyrenochaeta sp. DS3sAY3a]|nr:MFS general substrate transporter [Pyrenochaeta sp. DS3sAY3a]